MMHTSCPSSSCLNLKTISVNQKVDLGSLSPFAKVATMNETLTCVCLKDGRGCPS